MTVINDIKSRLDIVEVIGRYVQLHKAGRNFKAVCPFHTEKTPSFFVFPEKQSWHCFGSCSTGGDVFSFIMKKESVDFAEALKILADRAGVALVAPGPRQEAETRERDRLIQVNESAAEYYHRLLLTAPAADSAREYVKKRGISPETLNAFRLGYSPDAWESGRQYLLERGYSEKELVAAGLVIPREGGNGSYDRFRKRLMFPIQDAQGKVIGFGARALDDSMPKYMNSPQSAVFDKSGVLYGIDKARAAIRQQDLVIIVEGYMDVILAHQYGEQNVVASMGLALSDKHLMILRKLTHNVALALDADTAGEEATLRLAAGQEALGKDVVPVPTWSGLVRYENALDAEVKVVVLPRGKDPDEVIMDDLARWKGLVSAAPPIIDYAIEVVAGKADLSLARDKASAADKMLPLVLEIKDPVRQAHYVQKLARMLRTDERALWAAMKRLPLTRRPGPLPVANAAVSQRVVLAGRSPIEEYLLALLVQFPELKSAGSEAIPDYFEASENRELFVRWREAPDIDTLTRGLDDYLREYLEQLRRRPFPPVLTDRESERQHTVGDCTLRLKERWLKGLATKREELLTLEKQAEGTADEVVKDEQTAPDTGSKLKDVFEKRRMQRYTRRNHR